MNKDFSQCGEQQHILDFFGDSPPGRFLEIGAMDGVSYSNTYALVLRGWKGVALEPSPAAHAKLQQNLHNYPVTCVMAGLGKETGNVEWWDGGCSALGTTEKAHMEMWEKAGAKFTESVMKVLSWELLLELYGNDYDLVSIDTEGTSYDLWKLMPWTRMPKLRMMVVEHDNHTEEDFALSGWDVLLRNPLNIILVRR